MDTDQQQPQTGQPADDTTEHQTTQPVPPAPVPESTPPELPAVHDEPVQQSGQPEEAEGPAPQQAPQAPAAEPAAQEAAQPAAEPAAQPESSSANHTKKILLVEDDDNLASVYEMRLQAEGFDVQRVPNGEDALASALQYKPDLILLDVMMPKVSGFDVLDILRNTPQTANVRIVMLTALGQEADQQRAKDLGVDDYLIKSQVVIADVVDRIKTHLQM